MGPGKKPKVNMPQANTRRRNVDPSCRGGGCWSRDTSGPTNPDANRGQIAGQGPKVSFDNSRIVSQKELERRARKKEREGMTLGERVMKNAQEKKNKKAAEAAAKQQRYAGPRFL